MNPAVSGNHDKQYETKVVKNFCARVKVKKGIFNKQSQQQERNHSIIILLLLLLFNFTFKLFWKHIFYSPILMGTRIANIAYMCQPNNIGALFI